MLIPEKIKIFQRSEKMIGYTHIWSEPGQKYQRQLEANLLVRADRALRSPFRLVTWLTIRAIISHILWYAIA